AELAMPTAKQTAMVVLALYWLGAIGYLSYHAFKITKAAVGVDNRMWFFRRLCNSAAWMPIGGRERRLQTPELIGRIRRFQIQKYFIVGFWVVLFSLIVFFPRILSQP